MKKQNTKFRLSQVTKRLDHIVPEPAISAECNRKASTNLLALCKKLQKLLPDPTLSPEERLERLARVIQTRVPFTEHLQPANTKLYKLNARLNELVPGKGDALAKVDKLVDKLNKASKLNNATTAKKLESIGDPRTGFNVIITKC